MKRWGVVMSYRRRIYFTSEQKTEIWDRWQRRGPGCSRPLGRGPYQPFKEQLHCNTGCTAFAICDVGQGSKQEYAKCCVSPDKAIAEAAVITSSFYHHKLLATTVGKIECVFNDVPK